MIALTRPLVTRYTSCSVRRAECARLHLLRCTLPPGPERDAFKRRLFALMFGAAMLPMLPAPEKRP